MVSNEVLAKAVLQLANAIHHVNMNNASRSIASNVEGLVHGAQLQDDLKELQQQLQAVLAEPGATDQAHAAQSHVAAEQASADAAAEALRTILVNVISRNTLTSAATVIELAETAAKAFKAGLAAFEGATTPTMVYDPAAGLIPSAGVAETAGSTKVAMADFAAFAAAATAAADKRFAADPFGPTFELFAGEDAITAKLYPRTGSVLYLVNVTGPHSSAVKFEAALPKLVQVSQVVESPP